MCISCTLLLIVDSIFLITFVHSIKKEIHLADYIDAAYITLTTFMAKYIKIKKD
jgi:hypothetical protein